VLHRHRQQLVSVLRAPAQYWMLIVLWIRSALAYPASFVLMRDRLKIIQSLRVA